VSQLLKNHTKNLTWHYYSFFDFVMSGQKNIRVLISFYHFASFPQIVDTSLKIWLTVNQSYICIGIALIKKF